MGEWTSATTLFREVDEQREQTTEARRAARLAAIRGHTAVLQTIAWAEEIDGHFLGLVVETSRHRRAWCRRSLWYPRCSCGWKARQGYPLRPLAVAHWRNHASSSQRSSHPDSQGEVA